MRLKINTITWYVFFEICNRACQPCGHHWGYNIILVLPHHSWVALQPVWRSSSIGELCSKGLDQPWVLVIPKNPYHYSFTHCHTTMNDEGWLHLVASVMATRRTSPIEESENVIATYHFLYIMYMFSKSAVHCSAIFLTSLCQVIVVCFCTFFSNFS